MSRPRRPAPLYRVPMIVPSTPAEARAFMPALTNRRVIRAQLIGVFTGATQLTITTQPSSVPTSGVPFVQQPVIQLRDASNNPVNQSGVTITASQASGSDTLGGTLTAVTNSSGVASFTNLQFTGTAGANTIQFSATGLASVTSNSVTPNAGGFATPDIVNNEDFESGVNSGYGAFTDWTFSGPPTDGPTYSGRVSRSATEYSSPSHSLQRNFAANASDDTPRIATNNGMDADCLWIRFRCKLTHIIGPVTATTMKFCRQYAQDGTNLGGMWMNSDSAIQGLGLFLFGWDQENSAIITEVPVVEADMIDGNWHTIEIMICRNGSGPNPSDNPNNWSCCQFYFDGVLKAFADGTSNIRFAGSGNSAYWLNGVLYAGARSSSKKMRWTEWLGTLNGGNTQSGTIYLDDVSISTLGRVGS